MKTILIIFILLNSALSFSQWHVDRFYPNYTSVNFISGTSTGYAAAMDGIIRKSIDYGQTWTNMGLNDASHANLTAIHFININTGWAVGNSGKIYKTTNGGTNWSTASFPDNFFSVHFANASTGLIGSNVGKIYRTTNGGTNWQVVSAGGSVYGCVYMQDASTAFATSNIGLQKSTNSGANWVILSALTGTPTDLKFIDTQNGFYSAGANVYKTINGGLNWTSNSVPNATTITGITFLDINTGFGCDQLGKIFITTNSGLNWQTSYSGGGTNRDIVMQSPANLISVGSNGLINRSTNLGANWNIVSHEYIDDIKAISFVNINTGWVATEFGYMYQTTNSGLNWNFQNTFGSILLEDMMFFNLQNGWVISQQQNDGGSGVSIYRTSNSGQNWSANVISEIDHAYSLTFPALNTGYLLGQSILYDGITTPVYTTTNSGVNWNSIYSFTEDMNSLYFNSVNNGWACGDNGSVFKTTNAGLNWVQQPTGTFNPLYSVFFVNNNTGFACGDELIFGTTNGGTNWNVQYNTSATLYDISFGNANNGLAVGNDGIRLNTTNGGLNWILDTEPCLVNLKCAAFTGGSRMFCGGSYGYVASRDELTPVNPEGTNVPSVFELKQNYPNPFNPVTVIEFLMPVEGYASLTVFDISGKEVESLFQGNLDAGTHKTEFNGTDLASGVYFYRLVTKDHSLVKKMVILK